MRTLGACQRRCDRGEIEFHDVGVVDAADLGHTVQPLSLEIGLKRRDFVFRATRAFEVLDGLVVHREKAHGGAIFRRHVGDGGAVGQCQTGRALAEELDELAHHFFLAQHFSNAQHQVGGRDALAQATFQVHADHVGRQEIHRLTQHASFCLDAAHTPAHHTDAIDHGGVAVSAHQGVGVIDVLAGHRFVVHAAREIFQVDLVNNADAGRDDLEGIEGLHAPLHELIALLVALELQFHV